MADGNFDRSDAAGLAVQRAEHLDDRRARLAYVRALVLPFLEAANSDVDDAEADVFRALDDLTACRRRRDAIADMLAANLLATDASDPVRVLRALEAIT